MVSALRDVYFASGGREWTAGNVVAALPASNSSSSSSIPLPWLEGEPCINQWHGVYCCPSSHPRLRTPIARAGLASRTYACVSDGADGGSLIFASNMSCASGRQTGTSIDEAVCEVVAMDLRSNNLRGTLSPSIGTLTSLQSLDVSNNRLGGTLPNVFNALPKLSSLDVSDNSLGRGLPSSLTALGNGAEAGADLRLHLDGNAFSYPASERTGTLDRLVQRCKDAEFTCLGLPPKSCTAFGGSDGDWMVQAKNPDTCEQCGGLDTQILILSVGMTLFVTALASYLYLIHRYPESIRKGVSTASIIITHLQTVAILRLLQLHWPPSVEVRLRGLRDPASPTLSHQRDATQPRVTPRAHPRTRHLPAACHLPATADAPRAPLCYVHTPSGSPHFALQLHRPPALCRPSQVATSYFSLDIFDWSHSRPECLAQSADVDEEAGGTVLPCTKAGLPCAALHQPRPSFRLQQSSAAFHSLPLTSAAFPAPPR